MSTPSLAGIITKDDVFKKGGADYVPWSRIAQYIHEHANGHEFHLEPAPAGGHVWQAPNGTGYLVGYWTAPDDTASANFVYAITDHRNQPIPYDSINARQLCDSHRRAFCAAAAWQFGLGGELWAKQEVADAQGDDPSSAAANKLATKPFSSKAAPKAEPKAEPVAEPASALASTPAASADPPATKADVDLVLNLLKDADADHRAKVIESYRKEFGLAPSVKISTHVSTAVHVKFLQRIIG